MFALKSWYIIALSFLVNGFGFAQYINEFHYDNTGSDVGEFIEVVIPHPQPTDPENYKLYTYNGGDSMFVLQRSLSGLTPNCAGDSCFYVWTRQELLQNGPRDGIALAYESETDTMVFDFISYEGVLMALDGPARGLTSTDVGIEEDADTPVGWSLQKDSTGVWFAGPETPGSINPIELLTFTGKYVDDISGVLLEWVTASEMENDYFEIQRSQDQVSFLPIGMVESIGDSADTTTYTYVDTDPISGRSYYRLQQVDLDGTYSYSSVIPVDCPLSKSLRDLIPVLRSWELTFVSDGFQDVMDVTIYDSLGRRIVSRRNVYPGESIPITAPMRGAIFYLIQSGNQIHTGPIVVVNPR